MLELSGLLSSVEERRAFITKKKEKNAIDKKIFPDERIYYYRRKVDLIKTGTQAKTS